MTELLELAERCEKATGPDRELDAEIAAATRYFPSNVGFVWQSSLTPNSPEVGRVECCTSLGTGGPHYAAPRYTASIDAALTLVPEGFGVKINTPAQTLEAFNIETPKIATVQVHHLPADGWATAATPALALCAAALRAHHAETDQTGGK